MSYAGPSEVRDVPNALQALVGVSEVERARRLGVEPRQLVVHPYGDLIRVVLPTGYEDVVRELRSRFGDRVICEVADARFRYA